LIGILEIASKGVKNVRSFGPAAWQLSPDPPSGKGGFAEVYQGEHIYLKTQAAIKVLHEHQRRYQFCQHVLCQADLVMLFGCSSA
jgi:hypothetical protein